MFGIFRNRQIAAWKRNLKHVRFSPALDHMVRDREIFEVDIKIPETETAFLELCANLGITVHRIQEGDEVAREGTRYSPAAWRNLKFPIPAFPHLAQPKEQTIAGAQVHAWLRGAYLEIVIGPAVGAYKLDESDYQRAKAVDDFLAGLELEFREPV